MDKELEFLREQGVDSGLIDGVEEFRQNMMWQRRQRGV